MQTDMFQNLYEVTGTGECYGLHRRLCLADSPEQAVEMA